MRNEKYLAVTPWAALFAITLIINIVFADYAETVGQLVSQLESPILSERDNAQQQLFELGPKIEPLLPDESSVSPETRIRLKNLRRALLTQSIDQNLNRIHFTLSSLTLQETHNQMVARLMVDWSEADSEIQPIRWRFPLDFIGQSGTYDIPVAPGQRRVPIRFSWKATAEKSFHGKCDLLFAAGVHSFVFSVAEETGRVVRRENVVVTVQGTVYDRRTRQLKIRFLIEYDNALDAMQSHLVWVESNPAFLEGVGERSHGQTILADGPVQQLEKGGNRFVGTLSFRIPRETPWETFRFVYQAPVILTERTLEFSW